MTVKDTPAQTRDVLLALADEDDDPDVDLAPWLALQEWLASGDRGDDPLREGARGAIPRGPWARRDVRTLLGLIRAHALMHQATRERDAATGSSPRSRTTRSCGSSWTTCFRPGSGPR